MEEAEHSPLRRRPGYTGHHLRPSSRGGNHKKENVIEINHKALHRPYHTLFANLWPHEAALLLFFSWTTFVPGSNSARYARDTLGGYGNAWRTLFDDINTPSEAVVRIFDAFVKSAQVREFASYARKIIQYAQAHALQGMHDHIRTIPGPWVKDASYVRLFGELYPHEAILLVMLSWRTICPHKESFLPGTLLDKDKHPARASFQNRIKAWNLLFGEHATPWEAVETIERKFGGIRRSPSCQLITHAKRICRRMEKSGLLRF